MVCLKMKLKLKSKNFLECLDRKYLAILANLFSHAYVTASETNENQIK